MRQTPEFEQLCNVLAANVRRVRRARGVSQEQLAFDAEIDRTYVSQIERSVINPSLLVLHKVAIALETDVVALLSSTPPTNSVSLKA